MPHDPELLAETRSWFLKGSRYLEAGAFELTAPSPFTEDAVFHAQQAAEKALKGFLVWHGVPFRKTHNLEELGAQCKTVDGELKPVIDKAVPLTKHAWKFRYPGEPEAPPREEAQAVLAPGARSLPRRPRAPARAGAAVKHPGVLLALDARFLTIPLERRDRPRGRAGQ